MILWILIADESRARVITRPTKGAPLQEIKGFVHPKGRMLDAELLGDRPGRVRSGLAGRAVTSLSPHTDPKAVEAQQFAAELAGALRSSLNRNEFDTLALVAPPKFLGLLRQELDERIRERLVASSDKDLVLANAGDFPAHLSELLDRADQAELELQGKP